MILKGLSPGAALVFLLASPATNLAALVTISKTLGRRVLIAHVGALAIVTVALGALVDVLYSALSIEPSATVGHEHAMLPGWLSLAAALVLGVLLVASVVRTRFEIGGGGSLPKHSHASATR